MYWRCVCVSNTKFAIVEMAEMAKGMYCAEHSKKQPVYKNKQAVYETKGNRYQIDSDSLLSSRSTNGFVNALP